MSTSGTGWLVSGMSVALMTGLLSRHLIQNVVYADTVSLPRVLNVEAPELVGNGWLNASGGPTSLRELRGRVVVVHFWTYGCINCRRNLPIYDRWAKRFNSKDLTVIGVHTPEFENEAVPANVERRVKTLGISYPVLLDPDQINWRRWKQEFWPTIYLIDKHGRIRFRWDGEMNFANLDGERKMTNRIEQLLEETL